MRTLILTTNRTSLAQWRRELLDAPFTLHHLFTDHAWGLVVYDEVHLLTTTLVREDGLETDVFSLIGPKRLEVPW